MTDVVTLARSAREQLANGLEILQAPGVPEGVFEASPLVARTLGWLHELETSGGSELDAIVPRALATLQQALRQLQRANSPHPAVEQATAQVASSLGFLFTLNRLAAERRGAAPSRPVPPKPASGFTQARGVETPASRPSASGARPEPPPKNAPTKASSSHGAPPIHATPGDPYAFPLLGPQDPTPKPRSVDSSRKAAESDGLAVPPHKPVAAPRLPGGGSLVPPTQQSRGVQPSTRHTALSVEAILGAHTPTNFYRGLSGDDVVEHGGLFIATYASPEIGQRVALRVSLPGGYEFHTQGVVRWRRVGFRNASTAPESPPGYGVQLREVSPQARQLIERYTRNREPLLHDDS